MGPWEFLTRGTRAADETDRNRADVYLVTAEEDSPSSAQCVAVDLCIYFHQLLDKGSVMTIRAVIDLITVEGDVCISFVGRICSPTLQVIRDTLFMACCL